jgi:transcriptional regulator with XRE-family HTH domain
MNVQGVVKQLRTFMRERGYSESRLARESGVPQPTIHRALKNPVRLTKTHRTLCKFAGIDLITVPTHPEAKEELIQEVLDIWDGTREHAHSLARLLRAAATLQAYVASQNSRSR